MDIEYDCPDLPVLTKSHLAEPSQHRVYMCVCVQILGPTIYKLASQILTHLYQEYESLAPE